MKDKNIIQRITAWRIACDPKPFMFGEKDELKFKDIDLVPSKIKRHLVECGCRHDEDCRVEKIEIIVRRIV